MMSSVSAKALLLVGATASGKTPLGDLLQQEGLGKHNCFHFDFGAQLRRLASDGIGGTCLGEHDLRVIVNSLSDGRLLENETFHIARDILQHFVTINKVGADDLLVLNGLPRHVGQADDVAKIIEIVAVISLECDDDVVWQRILSNSGGDRTDRSDDAHQQVLNKVALFRRRTVPLLDHYRHNGVRVFAVNVSVDTSARDVLGQLQQVILTEEL